MEVNDDDEMMDNIDKKKNEKDKEDKFYMFDNIEKKAVKEKKVSTKKKEKKEKPKKEETKQKEIKKEEVKEEEAKEEETKETKETKEKEEEEKEEEEVEEEVEEEEDDEDKEQKKVEKKKEYKKEKEEKEEIKEEKEIIKKMDKLEIKEKKPKKEEEKQKEKEQEKRKISEYEMINQDPSLKPHEWCIKRRNDHFKKTLNEIEKNEKSLVDFAKSYENMGVHVMPSGEIKYREYAPGCKGVSLFGDFNNWNKEQYWAIRNPFGCWELIIPSDNGQPRIKHGQKIKANVVLQNNNWETRNPIWSHYLIQNKESFIFDAVLWNPEKKYEWKYPKPHMSKPKTLRVYECHVGMATNEQKVGTYREFADNVIPRIKKVGYNAIQLMAIMEHADYASFGYHVNSLFSIASRFGTPEDLMYLIDTAHQNGIFVIMDIVHSHASNNVNDGYNYWDGTDYLYFHSGPMGKHVLWDSRLFNYGSYETLRLLLSNCAFYTNVYHFDGFRFDGITSILYKNHGINYGFSGDYREYFGDNFDEDGGVYLMLANKLIHEINPDAITIAEDVSGMPGLCRPVEEGGFGFDYRLNMSVCDKWIQLLKEYSDENWNMGNIVLTLTNRRLMKNIQAIVNIMTK